MISVCGVRRLTFVTSSGRLTRTRVANSSFAKFSQYSVEAPTRTFTLLKVPMKSLAIKTSLKVLKVLSTSRKTVKLLVNFVYMDCEYFVLFKFSKPPMKMKVWLVDKYVIFTMYIIRIFVPIPGIFEWRLVSSDTAQGCVRTVDKAENWFIWFSIHDSLSNPLQRGGGESTAARGADQPSPPSSPPRTPGSRGRGRGRGQAGVSVRTGGGSRTSAVPGKGPPTISS